MADPVTPGPGTFPDESSLLAEALALHQQNRLAEAESRFQDILALSPTHFIALHQLGVIQNQQGEFQEGSRWLARALQVNPRSALAHFNLGISLQNLGRLEEACSHYDYASVLQPNNPDSLAHSVAILRSLHRDEEALGRLEKLLRLRGEDPHLLQLKGHMLQDLGRVEEALETHHRALTLAPEDLDSLRLQGQILFSLERYQEALASFDRALALDPDDPDTLVQRGNTLQNLQRFEEAVRDYGRTLEFHPTHPEARLNRSLALRHANRLQEALTDLDALLDLHPDQASALSHRGDVLYDLGRPQEALVAYQAALRVTPDNLDLLTNQGSLLLHLGRPEDALASYDRALELQPDHPGFWSNRSAALLKLGRLEEALNSCERALEIEGGHVLAHVNKGDVLQELRRPNEALAEYDLALALAPRSAEALFKRGMVLHLMGRHSEALESYEQALSIKPDLTEASSNKIYLLDFLPDTGFEEHQLERRRYFEAHVAPFLTPRAEFENDRNPERPLVLGYVSADFKHHSAALCFGPVLKHHDRTQFKIICYSGVQTEDSWTQLFRNHADVWRSTIGVSDEALATQVQQDRVDILIDLAGHSKGNRLLVFARKSAPIQVTAWGHGGGTGIPAVDYQFTDPISTPESARSLFAETCYDLPCFLTFEQPAFAPELEGLPAARQGYVTFGSLNRFAKVTPDLLGQWGRILTGIPNAQLLLKDASFDDPAQVEAVGRAFRDMGVSAGRLRFLGFTSHQQHLAAFNEVDIALDTYPQNGGITTWEALWMGAPVLTLLGNKPPSRISGAILHSLGLSSWIAESESDYVRLATEKAKNLEELGAFRQGIRRLIQASPSGNPELYTRAVEAGYRAMWRKWVAS